MKKKDSTDEFPELSDLITEGNNPTNPEISIRYQIPNYWLEKSVICGPIIFGLNYSNSGDRQHYI
ncbi:MAG: hypothetical protein ABH824_00745 [Nanoarchaeota archaeon]|nr:hypothetical protein [Nanoarchaeota archaeon]MBU1632180.1 hypothetical protein [Nanoarchaeota archaeon]